MTSTARMTHSRIRRSPAAYPTGSGFGPAIPSSATGAGSISAMSEPAETRDPRLSFGTVVDVYDEIRPTYPEALFDEFFALLAAQPEVLEVGPGTGQATKDLLARGALVHAVEISPSMAGRLRSNLPTDRLTVSVGDFETIDLAPSSADAVFSASAYHWISPAAQLDRPAQILRPGGVLAIVELIQVDSPEDRGFYAAAQPIYERYGQGHVGPPAPARSGRRTGDPGGTRPGSSLQ